MTKKLAVTAVVMFAIIVGLIAALFFGSHPEKEKTKMETSVVENTTPAPASKSTESSAATATPEATSSPAAGEVNGVLDSRFTDTSSTLLLANKKHALPDGYEPSDLTPVTVPANKSGILMRAEAVNALKEMFDAASADGVTLLAGSGYRSEAYQRQLYDGYVAQYGTARADAISSRPGYSDHQTGLALDISDHDGATFLTSAMENTPEGQWLYKHAHEYGFILRYPKGKEAITGYAFEPWHYRYVGKEWSEKIYAVSPDETFEEYFGVSGGDYAN